MLMAGKCIYKRDDALVKVQPEQLWHAVKNPKPQVESTIRQLRLVREIDPKAYQLLKKELPYVVAGIFNPPVRRTENFAWINHYILDIDHISSKEMEINILKEKLRSDPRVLLLFESPGEDGLKLLFRLSEKMYDPGKFSLFYKSFAASFSRQHGIEQVLDPRTSDATRACFVSFDPDAWFNDQAEAVDAGGFVEFENPYQVRQLKSELKEVEKAFESQQEEQVLPKQEIPDDALIEIRKRLNPSYKQKKEKNYYVPPETERLVDVVGERMQQEGIEVKSVSNISYGKKFKFSMGLHEAEINVFYGKKGYSVVISPRSGTRPELNELCAQLISELIQ